MKEELKQIIKELKNVLTDENLKISDFELMDLSLRVFITQSINKSKLLKNELSTKEYLEQNNSEKATPNQKAFLRKQKILFKEDLTKKEAYQLIKKLKEK